MPRQRPIPLWVGGKSLPAMRRAARLSDGWLPVLPATQAMSEVARFRDMVAAQGRDAAAVGVENLVFAGHPLRGGMKEAGEIAEDIATWQAAGANGIAVHSMDVSLGGPSAHIEFLRKVRAALGPV